VFGGFCGQVRTPFLFTIGDRGFAKAVSLPPQMQKPVSITGVLISSLLSENT